MAKNGVAGDGHRNGAVTGRSQTYNPKTEQWVKRDSDTGRFMDVKQDGTPFKGVTKEK
jgi:V8-like Glu-specific endopeptidase